ncbi:MAG: hypothetical protein J3Q66DRAFT_373188 [Benniella sp.]|nr:MAG: hypothetical protein J3Q66DRAFT_373188 [Benniella sp.]
MSSQNPLKIPEILWEVSQHVTGRTLLACVRVSKAWYQAFLPQIWRHIELTKNKPHPPGAIHGYMYSRFVKTLKIYCIPGREYWSLILPNLASLTVENAEWNENLFKLVSNYPMLIHLDIRKKMEAHSTRCLGLLTRLHSLKDVTLMGLEVNETNVDTFWQLCAQLERLYVSFQRISTQDTLPTMEFPRMRQLRAGGFSEDNIPWVLEFMQRCPGLRSLGSLAEFANRLFIPRITPLIRARKWPHLHSIALWIYSKDEDDLAGIITSMEKIIALEAVLPVFPLTMMDHLRPHFIHLQTLNLSPVPGFTSLVAQEIMSSCPSLITFKGCNLHDMDIVRGRPWVCLKLKVLELKLYTDNPWTLRQTQPWVLEQLSKLTMLQELYVYSWETNGLTLDLRLGRGLGRLSTLRSLWFLDLSHSTMQTMQQQEIEWMLKHWKSLERILGKLNTQSLAQDGMLKMQLKRHGIAVL